LDRVLDIIKTNEEILVVIITGTGDKAFVAGADIKELNNCDAATGKDFSRKGQMVFDKIEHLGKPVIAAINGFALGGGCELALSCHIRLCSENAKFGQPEVNLGIIPGYGGTQRLARLLNTSIAAQYILTGDMIKSEEAFRIGLVNSVYPQSELIDAAMKLALKIASKGQIAISYALKSIFSTNNINQIAKRANQNGNIYAADFDEIMARQDEIWVQQKEILHRIGDMMEAIQKSAKV